MIIEPGFGIAAFDLSQPSDTHAQISGQRALGNAFSLPCHLNLPSRLLLDRQERSFSTGSRALKRHFRVSSWRD
jgi:hypothetical protein